MPKDLDMDPHPDIDATFRTVAELLAAACSLEVVTWSADDLQLVWPESRRDEIASAGEPITGSGMRMAHFVSSFGRLTAWKPTPHPFPESTFRFLREVSEILSREMARRRTSDRHQAERDYRREENLADRDLRELAGESAAMRALRQAIRQVAPTDATVLILGETGTGKELVARAVHQLSPRRNELLVQVNCGALSPSLVTSELFGHEQGAFTGAAKQRVGRLELADGGTIFLDEIGEMPPDAQVLLLRALQERTIERVGGAKPIAVDLRIIAATHQDLEFAVEVGAFRADFIIGSMSCRCVFGRCGTGARTFRCWFAIFCSNKSASLAKPSIRFLRRRWKRSPTMPGLGMSASCKTSLSGPQSCRRAIGC
jgi:transcriptional regulator of acetoin/glycerol metabolism